MIDPAKLLAAVKTKLNNKSERNYFSIHEVRYRFILDRVAELNLPAKTKILDVGCFPLHLFVALKTAGFNVFGIASKHESVSDSQIVTLNLERDKLPFAGRQFELVLFFETLEHLLIDPQIYLKKLYQTLKPGAKLLLTTPNVVNLKNRARLLVGQSIYFPLRELYATTANHDNLYFRHNREYTAREVVEILGRAGFVIETVEHFNAYTPWRDKSTSESWPVRFIKIIGWLFTHLHRSLRDSIYIEASRPKD